ncbi:carbohydrate ABC transporter permease [Acetivibrio ethanolgignens]|uniref:Maltose/maltodextrin transport system permease protein n=1 Tax=Acetivibrio ethanolgignens TaxID=290052 RepID=A0A0V8QEB0_9FIRM|nr:sugar ABC transporter permease [Acetivibrio ethanolgignens]KSV58723.1 sugar ABC transporter permease [Acetivibrio ethanolgignens]
MVKQKIKKIGECCRDSGWQVKLSAVLMGGGQICYGRVAKGILFLIAEISILIYLVARGWSDIKGFFTLGTQKGDAWLGIEGENSVVMLLMGILAWIVLGVFLTLYRLNLKDVYQMQKRKEQGKPLLTFRQEVAQLLDKKFYVMVLALPVIGVCIFNILPIVFMILIAFTNYGGNIVPPELVDWVGIANFQKLVTLSRFLPTFFKILGWNVVWAILSTTLNYFAGLGLALLLEKECVKGKAFWRAFPVLAYAIPGFITLLAFKFMFSYGGPINQMIVDGGGTAIGFLDLDAKWTARLIGLLVNCWISVPSIMLLATGNLSNRDISLYEAAGIDGAGRWKQFQKLTMPFMLFSTMPVLLGQFIGNFNNFGIFYFLRGGLYLDGYFLASDTDLLINWLYNLSIDNNYYCIGAAISLVIFMITSVISLLVYIKSPSYREEDTFQ